MAKLFDELYALKKAYDEKLVNEGEAAVKELFKEFFDANPRAESVYWTQYTPYFNDGEPCYFSVHEFYLTLNAPEVAEPEEPGIVEPADPVEPEDEEDDEYYDDEEHDAYDLSHSDDPEIQKVGEGLGALQDIPDDVLEHVFGDHAKITATRDGFDVHEYSHD